MIDTERLVLREMTVGDYADLAEILQDSEVMYAYEHAFSDAEVRDWLTRNLKRYQEFGFGLWAVMERESGEFIGQCGLTVQDSGVGQELEIGYLFKRRYWHCGFATEAAAGCLKYAFGTLKHHRVVCIIRDNNDPSRRVAERLGMQVMGRMVKHYYHMDMPHVIYGIRNPAVEVSDYQPDWEDRFRELKKLLSPLEHLVVHVGSTSVPGLAAKPVIDADMILEDWNMREDVIAALARLGFIYRGDLGIPGREAFSETLRLPFAHNFYLCRENSEALHNHLLLRDYLRENPADALRYGNLKKQLAALYPEDVDQYCIRKSDLIAELLSKAGMDSAGVSNIRTLNLNPIQD